MFTRARHRILSWARWTQYTRSHPIPFHPVSPGSILILSSYLCLDLPSTILFAFLIFPCAPHPTLFECLNNSWWRIQNIEAPCSLLQFPVYFLPLMFTLLLSPYSQMPSILYSSLRTRGQVWRLCRRRRKIVYSYVYIGLKLFWTKRQDKVR
jgi:hypothetical protein